MAALFIPFGYPGYPGKEVAEHIEDSKKFLESSDIDFVSTNNIIMLEDCEEAVAIASRQNYDYIIVLIATWIEAPNMLNILSAADLEGKPILLWSHDNVYDPQEKAVISFGAIASAGVMRETFEELEYSFKFVVGNPGNERLAQEIGAFDRAATATAKLRNARLGLFGYASMGMYTGLGDHVKVKKHFGTETVHVSQYSILNGLNDVSKQDMESEKQALKTEWSIEPDIGEPLIDKTSALYIRLEELVKKHKLDSVSVKCQYEMSIDYGFTPCVPLSILGEKMPVSCEGDIYLLLSQMILHYISGKTTTYGDMLGFLDDGMICAACGYAPKSFLAAEKPCIKKHTALYSGLLITSPFKSEEVTVIRVANDKDGFKMHLIKGRTEELKDFHEIDCPQYAGAVIRFDNKNVEDFKQEIMSQHYAIVPGDHVEALEDFCSLKGIRVV